MGLGDAKTPSVRDPRWESWSLPILSMLSADRDWNYLTVWYKANRWCGDRFRHTLAWLEEKGLARGYTRDGVVLWVRTTAGTQILELRGAPKEPSSDALGETRLAVPARDLSFHSIREPTAEELRVCEEELASGLDHDLPLLRRDGVLGEEPLLVDGGLLKSPDELEEKVLVVGVDEEKLSQTNLLVAVEEAERSLDHPAEVEQVEDHVDVEGARTKVAS